MTRKSRQQFYDKIGNRWTARELRITLWEQNQLMTFVHGNKRKVTKERKWNVYIIRTLGEIEFLNEFGDVKGQPAGHRLQEDARIVLEGAFAALLCFTPRSIFQLHSSR